MAWISQTGMDTFSLPSLLCEEDESSLNEVKVQVFHFDSYPVPKEEDDMFIQSLIEKESTYDSLGCTNGVDKTKTSFKRARLDAVNWIFSTREILGFHFHTAYLSVTYLDRFFSKRFIDNDKEWAIQLLSIACLSLAAKMEEQTVPSLSQYKAQWYNFESSVIRRMELMVLNTLDWKMCSITPFLYLNNFFSKLCGEYGSATSNEFLVCKAIGLILDLPREISLMDYRPSVIAVAAVLAVCDDQLSRNTLDIKISFISSLHSLEKECIFSCFNLFKEIKTKRNSTPMSMISSHCLTNRLSPSSTISTLRTKRKLAYNDFEQHCPLHKISRHI